MNISEGNLHIDYTDMPRITDHYFTKNADINDGGRSILTLQRKASKFSGAFSTIFLARSPGNEPSNLMAGMVYSEFIKSLIPDRGAIGGIRYQVISEGNLP